ncbi:MAG: trypsin-like serine protease [Methylotenera sp.]|nr:trypsin-like serine protease [Oligoflexia bacterium]
MNFRVFLIIAFFCVCLPSVRSRAEAGASPESALGIFSELGQSLSEKRSVDLSCVSVGNGIETSAFPAVVHLSFSKGMGEESGCSGTVVGPGLILTAAHCACEYVNAHGSFPINVNGRSYESGSIHFHPKAAGHTCAAGHDDGKFRAEDVSTDLAILQFHAPEEISSLPKVAYAPSFVKAKVNSSVLMVGYGANQSRKVGIDRSYSGSGTLRSGSNRIQYVSDQYIEVDGDLSKGEKITLHGDSGGPMLQNGKIVAVCSEGGFSNKNSQFKMSTFVPLHTRENQAFLKQYISQ